MSERTLVHTHTQTLYMHTHIQAHTHARTHACPPPTHTHTHTNHLFLVVGGGLPAGHFAVKLMRRARMEDMRLDSCRHQAHSLWTTPAKPLCVHASCHHKETWVKVVNSWNTEGRGPGAAKAPDGGKGGNAPFRTEQFYKCVVVLWLLLATKVKLRTHQRLLLGIFKLDV